MKCNTATRGTSATVEVPAVGGHVQVRRIPPKLLREIRAKATKGGLLDFQELMVWKLVYGLRHPNFTEAEARRVTSAFHPQGASANRRSGIDGLSGTDEHLRGVDDGVPQRLRRYAEQMVMATAWLKRFPDAPSRVPRTTRARGAGRPAGRGASRRSSARSGDSGDDSDSSSDSSEPASRRLCAFCGKDIPPPGRRRRPTAPRSTPPVTGSAVSGHATASAASCRPRRSPPTSGAWSRSAPRIWSGCGN